MADEPPTSSKKDILIDETKSDPPPQGPSNIIKVTTKGGKAIVVKREGDAQVQYEQELEKPDLRDFKLRPVQNLDLASKRKYQVVGITMEAKYDDMTESEEEKEVLRLSKSDQAAHKEMKDLMTVQGCLKGQVPGFGVGIHAYVMGRYPGIPSELAKPYIIPEEDHEANLLTRIPPIKIEHFLQEHDKKIPRRDVVLRPGRKGITLSIDPNSDDELYEVNELEDKIETIIRLTRPKKDTDKKDESTETPATEETQETAETKEKGTDERVLVPDVISQGMADDYTKEEGLDTDEESDAETISSTSTADFDRDEAEDLLDKVSSCQTALSQHYNKLNQIVPHMTNAQMAQYLGKIHIMPLMKVESGPVSKIYTEEDTDDKHKFVVRGNTHEEKLQHLVEMVPAHRLLLAIAIGDIHLNSLTYSQASQKYEFSKSRIQRAISGRTEHKKGGKQYQQERKRKAEQDTSESAKKSKNDDEDEEEEEAQPVPACFRQSKEQDTLPDLVDDNDDQFPEVNIDA